MRYTKHNAGYLGYSSEQDMDGPFSYRGIIKVGGSQSEGAALKCYERHCTGYFVCSNAENIKTI